MALRWVIAWSCVWLLGWSQPLDQIPNPRKTDGGWVVDMAGVLSGEQKARLNRVIDALERETGAEVAVVILRRTQGATPKEYATELFNKWGVGKRDADNGVLMLVALGDRRVEIETGYGMEAIIPDAVAGEILDTAVVPRFKQGDIAGGVLAGVEAIAERIRQAQASGAYEPTPATAPYLRPTPYKPSPNDYHATPGPLSSPLLPFGGLLLIGGGVGLLAYALRERPPKCPVCQKPMHLLDENADDEYLTELQRTEEQLGSVNYHVWKCDQCGMLEIHPKIALLNSYRKCPKCKGHTVYETARVVQPATYARSGLELVSYQCKNPRCDYHEEKERRLPRLERVEYDWEYARRSRRRRDDDWFIGGGFGGWSSGGGFGGGGWTSGGGGSSGGGGAGRSWFAASDDFSSGWSARSDDSSSSRSFSSDDSSSSWSSSSDSDFGGGESGGGGAGRGW
ncbi:MAG: TPM domain-containing protein [Fimbriimonadales bacterium]|nr:TPM domain-containing protein [Fimbriimonadales bacterium]